MRAAKTTLVNKTKDIKSRSTFGSKPMRFLYTVHENSNDSKNVLRDSDLNSERQWL